MKKAFLFLCAIALGICVASCIHDDDPKNYQQWYEDNLKYIQDAENLTEDGKPVYQRYVPAWAPGTYVLMKWHNDTTLTRKNLSPLNNSTVLVKYRLRDINNNAVDSSYSMTTYGDSLFRTKVNAVIPGWQIALTNMHVGDSVTVIIPFNAAYGVTGQGAILPYSTLIFDMLLKEVQAYEIPY